MRGNGDFSGLAMHHSFKTHLGISSFESSGQITEFNQLAAPVLGPKKEGLFRSRLSLNKLPITIRHSSGSNRGFRRRAAMALAFTLAFFPLPLPLGSALLFAAALVAAGQSPHSALLQCSFAQLQLAPLLSFTSP